MFKKLIMSCMAVAAFAAFVLPAVASATNTPTLRDSVSPVVVGSKITGTNVGNTIFYNTATTTAQVTCTKANLTGEVTKNSEDTVEGKVTTFHFEGTAGNEPDNGLPGCTDTFGAGAAITVTRTPLILKSTKLMATHEFQISGTGGNIRFDIIDTTIGTCEYEATNAAITGKYTTGTSEVDSTLTTNDTEAGSGSKKIAGSIFCPSSGVLQMTFKLATDVAGSPKVWITET